MVFAARSVYNLAQLRRNTPGLFSAVNCGVLLGPGATNIRGLFSAVNYGTRFGPAAAKYTWSAFRSKL